MSYTQQAKSIIAVIIAITVIGVVAISQAGLVFAESSESSTKSASVTELWDVKIENGKAILWAEVKNTGTELLDSNCEVQFWVKGPDKWIDDYVGSRPCTVNDDEGNTGPVSPGESRWYKYEWTIPDNAISGDYRYWAIVEEGDKEISEWSSGKDFIVSASASKSASVTELWDVKIENGKAILWAEVKNTGTELLDSNCEVQFWVKGPDKWIDDYVGSRPCTVNDDEGNTGPVSPGESRWYKYEWTIPDNVISGDYRYWAIVEEGDKEISEWSSGKDFIVSASASKSASVTELWDVKIENGKAILWAEVKNTGTELLDSNCEVQFWVKGPDKWIDDYVGSRPCTVNDDEGNTGPVRPGESRWYKYEWTIPDNAISGDYRYWAIVEEGDKEISEWSSGKNFTISKTPTPTTISTETPASGSIFVSSSPSGADIYFDGTYQGTTPTTISDASPGSHTLKLEKYGYEEWLTSVDVEPGVTESITAQLTPADISPPAISIQSPIIIEQNNNELLEEGEKVKITYGANDPSGVASIKILLDGTMLESQNRAGTYIATTNSLPVGKHIIRIEATDSKSNSGFEELPITVERTGPSVYFGTTRTTIDKGEDAIFTLSAVNTIGNPSMTVQLILKPPSGVSVTSSSFAKGASGIYTCTQVIESGDNVRSIDVHLTGNQAGTHEIASEVYYQFEGSPKSPTRYETLTLIVEPGSAPAPTATESEMKTPGFEFIHALCMLLFIWYYRRGDLQ